MVAPSRSILIMLDPASRVLEIVTGGTVRVKIATRRGEIVNAAPEFEDCVRVATATGRPVKVVQAEALRAWIK